VNYQQLIQPNLSVVGQNGECLVYVREVFRVSAKYATATAAWENAQYKHSGTPPANAVPIWFSWEADGHVAVWDNGTIYSTTAQGDKTFASIQALMDYIGGGIAYLGWSEDINNVRVVQGENMSPMTAIVDNETATRLFNGWLFRYPKDQAEANNIIGMNVQVAMAWLDGQPERQNLEKIITANTTAPTTLSAGTYIVV
jgi:opacity protein-like surface antigen